MQKLLLILISSLILAGCNVKNLFNKKPAGLEITTNTPATVYLSDTDLGLTPVSNKNIAPGSYSLRIIPTDPTLATYETTIDLGPEVSTVISRFFAPSQIDCYGYTLTLSPDSGDDSYLSVISDPDTTNLTIDGVASGYTPLSKKVVSPGSHEVIIASPGYAEQKLPVNTLSGYNLIVNAKLKAETIALAPVAPSPDPFPSTLPEESPKTSPQASARTSPAPSTLFPKPYVIVLDTPDTKLINGLNIRSNPSSTSDPLGKAKIGEKLKYLDLTTDAGWHKVEFDSKVGYVSAKYVDLVK